jgi:benzodiazapine receptor
LAKKAEELLPYANIAAFIITLIINGLANTTLIGGRTTADISNMYPTLITPAGYVFAIWGIIYVLLAVFLVYQALPSQKSKPFQKQISGLFILTCVFNISWLFLWQNNYVSYSVILIVGFLLSLIAIYLRLNIGKSSAPLKEKLAVQLPFSVYLGWVTIATIANITIALTAANWDGFGIAAETWAVLVLLVALLITLAVIVTRRDIAFSLVIIWALAGIAVNQTVNNVILTAEIAIVVIVVALIVGLAVDRLRKTKSRP